MTTSVRLRAAASSARDLALGTELPYVALEHVESGTGKLLAGFEPEAKVASTEIIFRRGDVLFGKLRPYLAKVVAADFDGCASGEFLVLRPSSTLQPRYLYFLCLSRPFLDWAEATSVGTKMPRTDWDALSDFRFNLPATSEQGAIVNFLDRETARIDAAFAARTRLLELIREKWTAWVSDLTDNESWPQIRLKRLLSRPLEYGIGEAAEYDEAGWPRYIRTTDVTVDGDLRDETFKSLPPEIAGPYLLAGGDLLFTRSGATVGKSFLYREQWGSACFAGYLIRARVDRSKVLPQFLSYFVQSKAYWSQIKLLTLQATIPNVSAERYGDIVVRVPTVADQERVVKRLREVAGRISDLRNHLLSQVTLLRERRQALITATVTGQIHLSEAAT